MPDNERSIALELLCRVVPTANDEEIIELTKEITPLCETPNHIDLLTDLLSERNQEQHLMIVEKIHDIINHHDLQITHYTFSIWEKLIERESINSWLLLINLSFPFKNNLEIVQEFERKTGWKVEKITEIPLRLYKEFESEFKDEKKTHFKDKSKHGKFLKTIDKMDPNNLKKLILLICRFTEIPLEAFNDDLTISYFESMLKELEIPYSLNKTFVLDKGFRTMLRIIDYLE